VPIIAALGRKTQRRREEMAHLRTLGIQLVLFGTLLLASGFGGKGWKW
jgi:hypothetical protein